MSDRPGVDCFEDQLSADRKRQTLPGMVVLISVLHGMTQKKEEKGNVLEISKW